MAKIGLVTVLFNSESVLEGFFKSISIQSFKDYHLYLIDNAPSQSTDDCIASLTKKYAITSYTHQKNDSNAGVARGNNQGIALSRAANTSYTLLLNNDIEFDDPLFFEKLISAAQNQKEYIVIPKILFFDTRKIWMAGGYFMFNRGLAKHIGEADDDGPKYNKEQYFNYAPTCFMLIDNFVFDEVGIMDEKYFVYFDDTDFLYRCYLAGFKIKYLPKFEVLHKVSSLTGGSESLFSLYYNSRNRIYFINKNFKGFRYLFSMSFTLVSRAIWYFKYNSDQRKTLIKGLKEGFSM